MAFQWHRLATPLCCSSSAQVLKSTFMENGYFSDARDCEECKTSVCDAQNKPEGNWICIYVRSCKSNYFMQINANYAAGAEFDRNWEGEREWKDLRLEKLKNCATEHSSGGLKCVWLSLRVQLVLWHSSCPCKGAAACRWKKKSKQC